MNAVQNQPSTPEPSAPSPEVVAAFADLDAARARLRAADEDQRRERCALRRLAYKNKVGVRQARSWMREWNHEAYMVLIRAELEASNALRAFRRIAMIAAITRVVDTDRRIKAGQPLTA